MDRNRFEYLLEAYGADFARWPAAERALAEAYARAHANEIEALLGAARWLDDALDADKVSLQPSAGLSARILAAAPGAAPLRRAKAAGAGWALAACTLLGVLIGYGGGALAATSADQDDYFAAAFEAPAPIGDVGDQDE